MSYATTNRYETVYILRSGLSDADASAIHQKVESVVKKFKGDIQAQDDWGIQNLAYAIENHNSGKVHIAVYTGESGVVQEVERHFKISGDVLRFLTVMVEPDYDYQKAKKAIVADEEMRKNRETKKRSAY